MGIVEEKGIRDKKLSSGKYSITQDKIDKALKNELSGVRFTVQPTYNPRIRSYGKTVGEYRRGITNEIYKIKSIEVGPQGSNEIEFLLDTLLHEELEARIMLKGGRLHEMSDDKRHEYIDRFIKRFFKLKGWDYGKTKVK